MSGKFYQSANAVKRVRRRADDAKQVETDSERKTVSVEEAGQILGISRGAAYAYANAGTLPTIRLGRRMLVPKAALDRLLMTAGHVATSAADPIAENEVTVDRSTHNDSR